MIKLRNKLGLKLLIFVSVVSFMLITISFIYFFLSGKSFLLNSSVKQLTTYSKIIDQSINTQIDNYCNILSPLIVEITSKENLENKLLQSSKEIILNNYSMIDEMYLKFGNPVKSVAALPITVFGGKQVVSFNNIQQLKFDSLFQNIKPIKKSFNKSIFGYVENKIHPDYFIKKSTGLFSVIIKLKNLSFYENIVSKVYLSNGTNLSISNNNNFINFSTNQFWNNQQTSKYFSAENYYGNFFFDSENKLLYTEWQSEYLKSKIILSQDISEAYNSFINLLNKLLLYSIFIFFMILLVTFLYVKKISKSLNEITDITQKVSKRNFENKIKLQRKDELGLLINSFNQMIDELKISYSKLNIANKELKEKLEELSKTKIELSKKQKLAFMGETISKITHEIQNKISGVSVWVQNLEFQSAQDENISLYVNEIKKSLKSFMEMLQNFKKFYRKPYLEISEVDFVQIVEKVLIKYKAEIKEKNIILNKRFTKPEVMIFADANLMEEVIENLFVNAVYFSPDNSTIEIYLVVEKSKLYFSMCDEGPGISEENCDNIFHPFFTTKSSGSGLGLAIVKNIIDAHGGLIELEKSKIKGACFKITLPINGKTK